MDTHGSLPRQGATGFDKPGGREPQGEADGRNRCGLSAHEVLDVPKGLLGVEIPHVGGQLLDLFSPLLRKSGRPLLALRAKLVGEPLERVGGCLHLVAGLSRALVDLLANALLRADPANELLALSRWGTPRARVRIGVQALPCQALR